MAAARASPARTCLLLISGLLLVSFQPAAAQRALLQSDALSNSNGCLETIPKCEAGACATRNIQGQARWVCLRCMSNYEPVVDASGQDNIIQCVCPRSTYQPAASATRCERCPTGSFCPGGDKVENPSSFGARMECGANLVTRNTGARTQVDCVAPAGYAQTAPNTATPCERSEYAPQFNRLARCLRCQSGLEEPPASGLAFSDRKSKKDVCKVPPGRYMSQGLVRICAQGFYRENYTAFDAAVSQVCRPCNPGITTQGAGAKLAAECNQVLPGHGIQTLTSAEVPNPGALPDLPTDASGLPAATVCGIGYYSVGGYCVQCPFAATTLSLGAKSIEECVVPPGYSLQGGSMVQCGPGSYRERWVMFSDPRASNCTACGAGIQSEPRDLDEHPLAANGSYVRATSSSCFIEAGQGMIASGKNVFSAWDCPVNTYGVTGKLYGLNAAPCKPCPRNMITDGAVKSVSLEACINDDGFGYASEGASRCMPGFYARKGSRKPCQRCPFGRTTADNATAQVSFMDCYVRPGFGLVSAAWTTQDGTGYVSNTSTLEDSLAALTPVGECPVGYWGAGMSVRGVCSKCPVGSTTADVGSTKLSDCSICLAGYGQQGGSECTPCNFGSYHPGGDTRCTLCPAAKFYAPVDGAGDIWESQGTTLFMGSFGIEFCVPKESQLSPDAGQIYFSSAVLPELTLAVTQPSLAACIATCPPNRACMVQYNVATATCYYSALAWDPAGPSSPAGTKLMYKLPPSTLVSASSLPNQQQQQQDSSIVASAALLSVDPATDSAAAAAAAGGGGGSRRLRQAEAEAAPADDEGSPVRAKMMASGFYARCAITDDKVSSWLKAGVPLNPETAQTFKWGTQPYLSWDLGKSEADCQRKCDNSVVCWGFLYDTHSKACLYKGGEDALRSRSFFVMPNMVSLGNAPVVDGTNSSTNSSSSSTISSSNDTASAASLPVVSTSEVPGNGGVTTPVQPEQLDDIFENGTTIGTPSEQECFARCKKNQCCMLQYSVTLKACSLCDMQCDFPNTELIDPDVNGNAFGDGYRIVYKRPDNGNLANRVGRANNAEQYHRCKLHTDRMVQAYVDLAFSLEAGTATFAKLDDWDVDVKNEQECREKCAASQSCWGFIYYMRGRQGADEGQQRCLYKGGTDANFINSDRYSTWLI